MSSPALGLRIASMIFGLVGLGQLIRIITRINLQVGHHYVGRRWSLVAVFVLASLCVWLWALANKDQGAKAGTTPGKPA
jgi:hypothetical protein